MNFEFDQCDPECQARIDGGCGACEACDPEWWCALATEQGHPDQRGHEVSR